MARGDILTRRLLDRIATSPLSITVVYPAERRAAAGISPGPAPISPLTGPIAPTTVVYDDGVPATASVTIPCLWYDVHIIGFTSAEDQFRVNRIGWRTDSDALAVVAVADAAQDAADPNGKTLFSSAAHVEHLGHHYRVVDWEAVSRGFALPATYYVWLKGAKAQ